MKWPFRRNKQDQTDVPAEIQEYYQTGRRERTGVAWLLALGTLLLTIGLATLLFFGGRWLYRTVANRGDNNNGNTSQVTQSPTDTTTEERQADNTGGGDTGGNNTGTSSTNTDNSGSTQGSQTTPSTPATPSTPRTTTPTTGDGLPSTGPGNVVGLFAATTAVAGTAHYAINAKRRF